MTIEVKRDGKTVCTIIKGSGRISSDKLKLLAIRYNAGHLSTFNDMREVVRQAKVIRLEKALAVMCA